MTSLDHLVSSGAFDEPFSVQAMLVVVAAREWAAALWANNERQPVEFMNELPVSSVNTEEERTRQVLLDAVHDLEHRNGSFPSTLPPLFGPLP